MVVLKLGMANLGPIAIGMALLCVAPAKHVYAYSNPEFYGTEVAMGGGGGRWFTGSSADGYGCDVCHTGGTGTDLAIAGLPVDGYTPGGRYQITIRWPAGAQLALVAEFTDELAQGVGAIDLPNPMSFQPYELCSIEEGSGEAPVGLFEAAGNRKLFTVIDCGAQATRFRWTAPATASGPLWFNLGFVSSNEDAGPTGDGVTLVRRSLRAAGAASAPRVVAQSGCSVSPAGSRAGRSWWMLVMAGIGWVVRRRRGQEAE
jgi:MYXO-CTERM domain-containing protein